MTVLEVTLLVLSIVSLAFAWWFRARLRAAVTRHAHGLAEERVRHEAALEAEAKRVSAIFDRMIDGVIIVRPDGRINFANPAAVAFFETSAPMVGRTVLEARGVTKSPPSFAGSTSSPRCSIMRCGWSVSANHALC